MIYNLTKLAFWLRPYRKFLYFIAALLVGNMGYRLLYLTSSGQVDDSTTMLNLLALVWLALLNLMLNVFVQPHQGESLKISLFKRIKNKINQWFEYLLAMMFLLLTLAVILLSIRMIRV